jgi:hypothetical protein
LREGIGTLSRIRAEVETRAGTGARIGSEALSGTVAGAEDFAFTFRFLYLGFDLGAPVTGRGDDKRDAGEGNTGADRDCVGGVGLIVDGVGGVGSADTGKDGAGVIGGGVGGIGITIDGVGGASGAGAGRDGVGGAGAGRDGVGGAGAGRDGVGGAGVVGEGVGGSGAGTDGVGVAGVGKDGVGVSGDTGVSSGSGIGLKPFSPDFSSATEILPLVNWPGFCKLAARIGSSLRVPSLFVILSGKKTFTSSNTVSVLAG